MLEFGNFKTNTCSGTGRRGFLKTAAAVPLALGAGLPTLAQAEAARKRAKAKSVLLLWLWGGPSHIDMVDPKPDAPMEYRGPFGTTATKTTGMRFTELLPRMAARSDKYSVIRSMVTTNGGHPGAGNGRLDGL